MFNLPKEIIVWDSEFTAWPGSNENGWTTPGEAKEIVQIGAIRVRTSDFAELDKFEVLIKPVGHSALSDYFIKLTGITQEELDKNGKSFREACRLFFNWVGSTNLYSWNLCDFWALAETCKINNMVLPIKRNRFFDIRMVFWKAGILAENYYSSTIIKAFKQKPKCQAHSALNDAQTIIDALQALNQIN